MKKISSVILFFLLISPIFTVDFALLEKKLVKSKGREKIKILLILIDEYLEIDNPKAETYLDLAVKQISLVEDAMLKIDIFNCKAKALIYKGKFKDGIKYAKMAIGIAKKLKNSDKIAESLTEYGRALAGSKKINEALAEYNKALKLNSLTNNLLLKGKLNLYIGVIYSYKGEYSRAKKNIQNASSIFRLIKNMKYEAESFRSIGLIYNLQNDYSKALDYFIKSLKYFEKSSYKRQLAYLLNNIAGLYYKQGNSKKALELYLQVQIIAEKFNYQNVITASFSNIGIIYKERGDFDKSMEYYSKAIKNDRKTNDKLGIAIDLYNIGNIYLAKYQLKKAENYIMKSLKISQAIKDKIGLVMCFTNLGHIKKQQNNFKKALEYLQRAYTEIKSTGSKELVRSIYEEYSSLYSATHQHKKAIEYRNKSDKLRKEILNEESAKRMAETRTRFETEKKEVEIKNLKLDRSLRSLELKKKELQKNIVIVGSLIGFIILILLYRQFRLKNKSNKLIKIKNIELEKAYKKLELVASTDPLTMLSNRRDILKKISYELERFERNKKNFTIILSDIDKFKLFNDNYGHDTGDFILIAISSLLKESIRQQDTVSRWGGEEFLIFLPETELKGAGILAEKIRKKIQNQKFKYKEINFEVSLTFGVSEFREGMDLDNCIKEADNALYKGKVEGRNRVILSSKQQ